MILAETKPKSSPYDLSLAAADYPPWQGPPCRTLVICSHQRTGSTLLGEAIYFAGGLGCPLEYFHAGFRPGFDARWQPRGIHDYVGALHRNRTDPSGVFSVKMFWRDIVDLAHALAPSEIELPSWQSSRPISPDLHRRTFALMRDCLPNPAFILLGRRHETAQAVSHFVAMKTQRWRQLRQRKPDAKEAKTDYSFDAIFQLLTRIQIANAHWRHFFSANALPYHAIAYEDLAQDYEPTLRRVFDFAGRPNAPILPPRMQKQAGVYSQELLRRFMDDFHRTARG